jgi:hypothetical protein
MTNELLEAAKAAIQRSAVPMTIGQIRTEVGRERKVPGKDRFIAEVGKTLRSEAGVYVWPEFKRSALFFNRPLAASVDEELVRALDQQPLTITKAGAWVKKALGCVSETRVLKEIKVLLPRHTTSGRVIRLAVGQVGIYLSKGWIAKQVERNGGGEGFGTVIPRVIARLQSGPGNYVRVDRLRAAKEFRTAFDHEVIRLADKGGLVLGRYDGPLPVPEDEAWAYVEDDKGELFVGVALPRSPEEDV